MLTRLRAARSALEAAARDFDASACSGDEAIELVEELGVQRRLIDAMLGKAAKRGRGHRGVHVPR